LSSGGQRLKSRQGAICVFAKVPRPGHVKTRLARTRGAAAASALAAAFLEDTVEPLLALDARVILAFDGEAPERWRGTSLSAWRQGEGNLGDRLERVLARALQQHPWSIALGADSPGLPRSLVEDAIGAFARRGGPEAVLGPCRDGGFYLLGLRALRPGALASVRWSTSHALEDTERSLRNAGLEVERLAAWFDVDEESDLRDLEALLDSGAIEAPATALVLRSQHDRV
jgi:rSAM/selenodomain-associated transferase 1